MYKHPPISPLMPHFIHGGDYNPDQWLDMPEIIEEDMRLQTLARCNTMTLGIFCWTLLEPSDGVYDFSYLDNMIKRIGDNGGKVILATPSGAKPAWMSEQYPEILRVNSKYQKLHHGERHNHCFTSPVYRRKVTAINELLAERYGNNDTVLAWHISNEYGGMCYCDLCQESFRKWLQNKYKTLDALNQAYCSKFWNHTFTAWSQLEAPGEMCETKIHALTLDWRRFISDSTIDFMKNEIAAIKKYSSKPVTTNFVRFPRNINYVKMAKELDVASWDAYPSWHAGDDLDEYAAIGFKHDFCRSCKDKPFLLMESTPSLPNWHPINKLKRPGANRLGALQAIAHGSDSVQYFQWRKSRGCSEKFHGAVVDHCGHENTRVFREVAQLGVTLSQMDEILGTCTESEVAFIYDTESCWALEGAEGFNKDDKKILETFRRHYKMVWSRGINADVKDFSAELSKYKVVFAPMMYMVTDKMIDKIEAYVRGGGTFVTTYMAGMVDESDLCHLGGFPGGKLKDVFGLWNEEIDTLYPYDSNRVNYKGTDYRVIDYCEVIHPSTAEVLTTFQEDFYSGSAALCKNAYGKGRAYYIAFRDTGEFLDAFYGDVLAEAGVRSSFDGELPLGTSAHSRTDGENEYVFVGNYTKNEQVLSPKTQYIDFETGKPVGNTFVLAPYGSVILTRKR